MTLAQSPGRIETVNGVQLYFEVHGRESHCSYLRMECLGVLVDYLIDTRYY